jgi:hypothetical protein
MTRALLLTLALCVTGASAAPAPLPRKEPPVTQSVTGAWSLDRGFRTDTVVLLPDGTLLAPPDPIYGSPPVGWGFTGHYLKLHWAERSMWFVRAGDRRWRPDGWCGEESERSGLFR